VAGGGGSVVCVVVTVGVVGGVVVGGVVVGGVVVGGWVVGGAVVVAAVVGVCVGFTVVVCVDDGVADGDTVLRLVLVPTALAPVGLTEAVTPLPGWLVELDVPTPLLPVAAGGFPPEASKRAMTAATQHAATPAPPAMSRRRVNGEPTGRSESGSG